MPQRDFPRFEEGGVARIVIPDLDKIVKSYDSQHPEDFLEAIFEAKQKHSKNKHHWLYNEISLTKLLKKQDSPKLIVVNSGKAIVQMFYD